MKNFRPYFRLLLLIFFGHFLTDNSLGQANLQVVPSDSLLVIYKDVSTTNLPLGSLGGNSMDANMEDIDNDGDIDIVIAGEFIPNILLINDGKGIFTDESAERLPQVVHDSEDIGIADFDMDGDPDIVFVSEDDQVNELYFNDGDGFFTDVSNRIPVNGTSNAVLAVDVNNDSIPDILIGNQGQNIVLINDGNGLFTNETTQRLPANTNTTQDLEWGDIDNDGDNDLLEGNENGNRLLLNDGDGFFTDVTVNQLPLPPAGEETREADFGDVDGDGDLDILFANVTFTQGQQSQNRLLLNDGSGFFTDVTSTNLPAFISNTVDGDFIDVDIDGDLDILTAQAFDATYQALLNDGTGIFTDRTDEVFLPVPTGNGIDIEAADFNGDDLLDLYLTGFQQTDYLYLAEGNVTLLEGTERNHGLKDYQLFQNYPNPFNPTTKIKFTIPTSPLNPSPYQGERQRERLITLNVHDVLGNEIQTLINTENPAGQYEVEFNGDGLPSGLYFYTLQVYTPGHAGGFTKTKKMILLR
jgi:hypothetical protein